MAKRGLVPEDLFSIQFPSEVQVHPSEHLAVACVKSVRTPGTYRSRLVLFRPDEPAVKVTSGEASDTFPRWSPDGRRLAFLSNRKKPGFQIFVMGRDWSEPRPLTRFPEGTISGFEWSPRGDRLAVLFREQDPDRTEKAAKRRKREERSAPPHEITTWPWRLDGDGIFGDRRHHLYLVDAQTGAHSLLFAQNELSDLQFAWSPDGNRLALAYRPGKERFREAYTNELLILNLLTGVTERVSHPEGELSALAWSPDGRWIIGCFAEHGPTVAGPVRHQIALVDAFSLGFSAHLFDEDIFLDTSIAGDVREPAPLRFLWSADSSEVVFHHPHRGGQHLARFRLAERRLEPLTQIGNGEIHLTSRGARGRLAGAYINHQDWPCEVYLIDLESQPVELVRVSRLHDELMSRVQLSVPESHWIDSADGTRIQAWILKPVRFDPHSSYRAAIEVHGGPALLYSGAFFFEMQVLAAKGFAVFFCNPRGSTGYGEEHARAILGRWGSVDWEDIQALTRFAREQPWVDARRICILGGSYGGFMVNWAISHSQDYARAVTDRCVSNLLSKWGNSDYAFVPDLQWPGAAFGDSTTLWERSPIRYFSSVRTPTLVIHSAGDLRCNIEQGEQVYTALKLLGVETKFIRYPETTSHGMSRTGPPDLKIHRLNAILDWLMQC